MVLLGPTGLLKDLKYNLWVSNWLGTLPFKWNKSQNRLALKSKFKRLIYAVRLYSSLVYFFFSFYQMISVATTTSLMVNTHSVMFGTAVVMNLSFHLTNYSILSDAVNLCNCFIDYEERQHIEYDVIASQEERKNTDILVKYLIPILTLTGVATPMLCHMDLMRNPCFPLYVGYWLSDLCEDSHLGYSKPMTWSMEEVGIKLAVCILSFSYWSFFMSGLVFQASLELVLHGHCLRTYIDSLGRKLMKKNTVDQDVRKLTLSYRQLQLMTMQYRFNYSRSMIGCGIPCFVIIEAICIYNTVQIFSGVETGGSLGYNLLYVWCSVICLIVLMYVFGILADVYKTSKRVQEKLNENVGLKRNKWFSKWLKSCPVLKIYFGGSNFLDQLTPLNFENLAINLTVNLLLLRD